MELNDLSIIIPFLTDHDIREHNFNYIHKYYTEQFPESKVIVGTDTTDYDDFCKSNAINNGVQESSGNILLLVDADIIIKRSTIKQAVKSLSEFPFIIPFGKISHLDEYISNEIITDNKPSDEEIEEHTEGIYNIIPGEASGWAKNSGTQIMTRDIFNRIGGYCELFHGYGYEDTYFNWKIKETIGDYPILPKETVYHLYHPSGNRERGYENYQLFRELGGREEEF